MLTKTKYILYEKSIEESKMIIILLCYFEIKEYIFYVSIKPWCIMSINYQSQLLNYIYIKKH
jgi:hypothetical protein